MVVVINPSERSIDYNIALIDIGTFIEEKRERGWNWLNITDAILALSREGTRHMNRMLEDMADRLEEINTPPGYGRTAQGELFKLPPELGTEADHPDYDCLTCRSSYLACICFP